MKGFGAVGDLVKISIGDLAKFVSANLQGKALQMPSRVLIVNDDGSESPYTFTLADLLRQSNVEVYVVVPYLERSACSHSVSVYSPVRLHKLDQHTYMPEGTPVDCVKIAVKYLFPEVPFDIVISGPNSGYNLGRNIIYSGTVGAALEAAFWGVLSVAVSFPSVSRIEEFKQRFSGDEVISSEEAVRRVHRLVPLFYSLARLVKFSGLDIGFFINVNFPLEFFLKDREIGTMEVFFARPGRAWFREWYEIREDPQGRKFLWLTGEEVEDSTYGVDSWAVSNGMISVSLLSENFSHLDITEFVPEMAEHVFK